MVVRGEDGLAADHVVEMLGHRPGDRHAVVGRGPAADLVEQHEAPAGRPVEGRARFAHLHHEGGLAARQVVRRADAGEQPVHRADHRAPSRHERPHLREQHAQPHLPEQRGLSRHVRPGQQDDPAGLVEPHVVGNERLARHHPLDHRVAGPLELDGEPSVDLGPRIALAVREVGQGAPHVELRQRRRGHLHPGDYLGHGAPQRVHELGLAGRDPLLGAEHLRLILLELRRDVPLGAGERLPPLVVVRDSRLVRVRHLDVVPEHLVESHLEGRDAGALPLARLEGGDVLLAAVPRVPELVELAVVAGADRVAFRELHGRPLHERARELVAQIRQEVEALRRALEQRAATPVLQTVEGGAGVGEPEDGVAQRPEVARRRAPQRCLAREPLQVAHAVQGLSHPVAPARVGHEHPHRVEPRIDRRGIHERREQPAAQQPGPHRRHRAVQHLEQRRPGRSRPEWLHELEVAPRHLVEREHVARAEQARAGEMRETGGLQFARVPEQRARGAQRRPIARLHPKPVERSQPERARQVLAGELGVELPDLAFGPGGPIRERRDAPVRRHDFGRLVARQRGRELFGRHGLEHELAGRQVEGGDPRGDAAGIHRHQEVVAVLLEPVVRA